MSKDWESCVYYTYICGPRIRKMKTSRQPGKWYILVKKCLSPSETISYAHCTKGNLSRMLSERNVYSSYLIKSKVAKICSKSSRSKGCLHTLRQGRHMYIPKGAFCYTTYWARPWIPEVSHLGLSGARRSHIVSRWFCSTNTQDRCPFTAGYTKCEADCSHIRHNTAGPKTHFFVKFREN